ncbi:hypothetical protein ACWEQG_01600 [Microbispora sp. NPDC004025]
MAPRISVHIETLPNGRKQARCDMTDDCTAGPGGTPWRGEEHAVKAAAEAEARTHRQWHRAQLPVPTP